MKKYFISAALIISVCATVMPAHARVGNNTVVTIPADGSEKVHARIQSAFQKAFPGATVVSWERLKENICQAKFTLNNERLNAFFNEEGELVAIGRFIMKAALPLTVQRAVSNKYAADELQQVIEITQNNATSYLLSFENEQLKTEVQAYSDGKLIVFKKEKRIYP